MAREWTVAGDLAYCASVSIARSPDAASRRLDRCTDPADTGRCCTAAHLIIEFTEGRNREIRQLLQSSGHELTRLLRVAFGGIELGTLQAGAWRDVRPKEITRQRIDRRAASMNNAGLAICTCPLMDKVARYAGRASPVLRPAHVARCGLVPRPPSENQTPGSPSRRHDADAGGTIQHPGARAISARHGPAVRRRLGTHDARRGPRDLRDLRRAAWAAASTDSAIDDAGGTLRIDTLSVVSLAMAPGDESPDHEGIALLPDGNLAIAAEGTSREPRQPASVDDLRPSRGLHRSDADSREVRARADRERQREAPAAMPASRA